MRQARSILVGLSFVWAACGGEPRSSAESQAGQQPSTEGMAMPRMQMPSLDRVPALRAYLDTLASAEPAVLALQVADHGARIEGMLAAMSQDMKAMNMTADAAWRALEDSVRADLQRIPQLSGEELVLLMRAHAGRMRRLLQMHEAMMKM